MLRLPPNIALSPAVIIPLQPIATWKMNMGPVHSKTVESAMSGNIIMGNAARIAKVLPRTNK